MDEHNHKLDEINQKIDSVFQHMEYYHQQMDAKVDESLRTFANMQLMLNTLTQITSSQVNVLNQMSQQVNFLTSKISDMEINSQDNDTALSEIVDNFNNIVQSIEELKQNIEAIRQAAFYSYD